MLIVVLIAFNNPELMNAWDVLFTLDKRWLLLCLLAMVGYVYAEGAGLCTFLRMEGYKVSLNTATHFLRGHLLCECHARLVRWSADADLPDEPALDSRGRGHIGADGAVFL